MHAPLGLMMVSSSFHSVWDREERSCPVLIPRTGLAAAELQLCMVFCEGQALQLHTLLKLLTGPVPLVLGGRERRASFRVLYGLGDGQVIMVGLIGLLI